MYIMGNIRIGSCLSYKIWRFMVRFSYIPNNIILLRHPIRHHQILSVIRQQRSILAAVIHTTGKRS